jgi:hypothetical protein
MDVTLTVQQKRLLQLALADAINHREALGSEDCATCEAAPSELCEQHAADFALADDYHELARQIGLVANPGSSEARALQRGQRRGPASA